MKVVWTEPARQDLRQIFEYIAEDSPKAASKLLSIIQERAVLLQDNPHMGRMGRVDGTRELVIAGTTYILPYRVKDNQIQILAVFHEARQWPETFELN
ncbi:type II toxin-antitoxin system mRNA interferase toxin, RelE/StbE family [Methylomicrobium album]|uniref:Addiction module toxin, RelE/StbE family n=1 Tax=Methylomicrobium album BG8 TaxID=686340 RepID=H8GPK9_METAL|nr:type II toxin-antitoxin system mRNA interferase toxin, RelE/StbE family [Methylomicrobium album]EIC28471.1 addiction module toxin, RelE/StbE family [Methylomicrobium album BG8]